MTNSQLAPLFEPTDEDSFANAIFAISDTTGIYIPQVYANSEFRKMTLNVTSEAWDILEQGPDNDYYWETWDDVINEAKVFIDGDEYTLWQDGDLWLMPVK